MNEGRKYKTYIKRNRVLRELGFSSYSEYLETDLWQAIRSYQLSITPVCEMCDKPATVVHHTRYAADVMVCHSPKARWSLVSLCRGCHYYIEFDESGEKGSWGDGLTKLAHRLTRIGSTERAERLTRTCGRQYSRKLYSHISWKHIAEVIAGASRRGAKKWRKGK